MHRILACRPVLMLLVLRIALKSKKGGSLSSRMVIHGAVNRRGTFPSTVGHVVYHLHDHRYMCRVIEL